MPLGRVGTATGSKAAHASYMAVCMMASAREATVGPGLASRTAWSAALFHWMTTSSELGEGPPAKADPPGSVTSAPASSASTPRTPAPARSIMRLLKGWPKTVARPLPSGSVPASDMPPDLICCPSGLDPAEFQALDKRHAARQDVRSFRKSSFRGLSRRWMLADVMDARLQITHDAVLVVRIATRRSTSRQSAEPAVT